MMADALMNDESRARASGHRNGILVIEDDEPIRSILVCLLIDEGYNVRFAANGREGLGVLHSGFYPEVILLDLMMPVMDGLEFRDAQMADPDLSAIPVVVMSADANVASKSLNSGIENYLKKPLDIDNFLGVIGRFTAQPAIAPGT
jgi:CheY-like chemotaxis protein